MPSRDTAKKRPRGGLPDKRRAILSGALTVFARDGYTRAGIDTISAQAGVSTRTIYNHFEDKATLFHAVIQESAQRVADTQIAIMERHLTKIGELESDLVEFGEAWVTAATADHPEHFALVRQINAETGHIPQDALDAWQAAGPMRVRRELGRYIKGLSDRSLLRVADPERAAVHLLLLVSAANPSPGQTAPVGRDLTEAVRAGIQVFLYGYR
jgi:AcrR family transcriptional regulator